MGLRNVISGNFQNYVSPFFIFDEFGPMYLPKGVPFRVDAHPQSGIIATTYVFGSNAYHLDSMGNDFQYHEGDFIQFTSGKGALHMEETGDELFENGGTFHGIQSWLNIPPHLKKSEPYATHLKKEDSEVVEIENVRIRVILGKVFGVISNVELLMPVNYWHISMKRNAMLELPVDPAQNAFVYLLKGRLEINGTQDVKTSEVVLFVHDGNIIRIKAISTSDFLVLGGEVNNELYAPSVPFVLNNEQDLANAYNDFRQGKFGSVAQTNGVKRQ